LLIDDFEVIERVRESTIDNQQSPTNRYSKIVKIKNHGLVSARTSCAPSNVASHERTAIASLTTSIDRNPSKTSDTSDHFWHGL
jgi:hypothetical protein